jgi:nucleotide-binding universal stress UspA family protein
MPTAEPPRVVRRRRLPRLVFPATSASASGSYSGAVKRMVVAYDGSAPARRALERASEFAKAGDRVAVVNVMPEPGVGAAIASPAEAHNRQWHVLDEARQFMAGRGIEAAPLARVGEPAAEILAVASEMEADVIIVARHAGKMPHPLGSISGRIMRAAPCDVLVVHAADAPA